MIITLTEENYLKAIFHLSQKSEGEVSTNAIAEQIDAKASSVTEKIGRKKSYYIYQIQRCKTN